MGRRAGQISFLRRLEMPIMSRGHKRTGSNGQAPFSGIGTLDRAQGNGSGRNGADPQPLIDDAVAATEASLSEARERRLAEVRLRNCE
jgi:hypothetical protein